MEDGQRKEDNPLNIDEIGKSVRYLVESYKEGNYTNLDLCTLVIDLLTPENAHIVIPEIPEWLSKELCLYYSEILELQKQGRLDELLFPLPKKEFDMARWYMNNIA